MPAYPSTLRRLVWLALLIACIVVPLGAYVRLSDAGLGCPDWPGCYGQLSPAHARDVIVDIHSANPAGPVSMAKAWKEMAHRYLASALGLIILLACAFAWWRRLALSIRLFTSVLLLAVMMQGLLGMWTVTLLLKPVIVSLHLIGGMLIVALLAVQASHRVQPLLASALWQRTLAWLLLAALLGQILLGGWVSSNYAALACQGFPTCNGQWQPADMRFDHAFQLTRELGMAPDGSLLLFGHLVAIHWLHRVGAVLVSCLLLLLVWTGRQQAAWQGQRRLLFGLWLLQIALGAANVLAALPLPVAVAHNAVAMLLLACTLTLALRFTSPRRAAVAARQRRFARLSGEHA
ncbi:COX15/CtaA family protein [Craterilacuibacter sp.]|uniref:COX15/CtaA family protein n=1 Tax=Craterilacuibacter sp. TaxID=2870909 RepID=UPI003F402015